MTMIKTTYLGLELKSPIIAGSSELTNNIDNLIKIEQAGAGAVVLKSLFEEQIKQEQRNTSYKSRHTFGYIEAEDYISNYVNEHQISEYLALISKAKGHLNIPVIASINCISSSEWISYAKEIEIAGADALELNLFVMSSDPERYPEDNEDVYFDIINDVKREIKIPISFKISPYFSSLAYTVKKLSWTGVAGIVLFNRYYAPDIDIDNLKVVSSNVYSSPSEISTSLKWISMLSDIVDCDLCASTGVHDGNAVIKQILAGAKAVQVCSVLYKDGFDVITTMNNRINEWMEEKHFETIECFRGRLSLKRSENPAAWERVQYMHYFAGIE